MGQTQISCRLVQRWLKAKLIHYVIRVIGGRGISGAAGVVCGGGEMTAAVLEEEEEEEESRMKSNSVLVGMKVGAGCHELLTWALVKVAQPADQVIALHVVTAKSELSSKDQSNINHQLVTAFNSAVEVYEGFCSLKQVDLQFKITHGSSVQKVLVEEAKLYDASKVILGASKHNAIRSSLSVAKYCVKRLPCCSSVLVVENGKIIFERCGREHLSVAEKAVSPGLGLLNRIRWRIRSKNCKALNSVVECSLDRTVLTSSRRYDINEHGKILSLVSDHDGLKNFLVNKVDVCNYNLSEMETLKRSCLPLKPNCPLCQLDTQTLIGNEKKDAGYKVIDSASSCDSFQTVCSTSSLVPNGEGKNDSCAIHNQMVPEGATPGLITEKGESLPGWPLLRGADSLTKLPISQSTSKQMSVVEWALQLPNRLTQATGELQLKEQITQKVCNYEHEAWSSNEDGFPCSQQNDSNREENYLARRLECLCQSKNCRHFTYQELQSATSSFSAGNFIGRGGWSQVYRGFLPDGQSVAVKILNSSSKTEQELLSEVEILTLLKHNHIITLIGYCVEGLNRLLVYNFVSRGNLEENLHGGKEKPILPWKVRLKVAVGVAEALDYLHNGFSQSVIHGDVKSSNILLSEEFEPQLSDFGLARWAPTSSYITCSDVLGTFGYLAPEYFVYGKVNDKTDVYAFGVVLLELITGRKPIDRTNPKGQESLIMWARPLLQDGNIGNLADKCLQDVYDTNEMHRMMLAATLCLRQTPHYRPCMSRILKLLQGEDDITDWAWCQKKMIKDMDTSDEDDIVENQGGHDIQTHLTLAMLGVDDDNVSLSSMDHSVGILQANSSLEDYLQCRCSNSSSFD